jgi:hypothetical protein
MLLKLTAKRINTYKTIMPKTIHTHRGTGVRVGLVCSLMLADLPARVR